MNKKILLISSISILNCLGWPGFGKKTPEFKIGDSIEVPENRIIIDKRIFVRPLDLNEPEMITHARFMDLYDEYEESCLPMIIVRVNQGENELIYNLYDYYSWITKNPGKSPINTPIENENYYHLKKIGGKLCLVNLGNRPAISIDDMIYYSCALERENYDLFKSMIADINSKLNYREPRMEAFNIIVSDDNFEIKLDKLMRLVPSYSETDPFIHFLRFYCGTYSCLTNRSDSAIELLVSSGSNLNKIFKTYSNYFMSQSLAALNRDEEAVKIMEDVIGSKILNIECRAYSKFWLGKSLSCLDRHEEAIKLLEESLCYDKLIVPIQAHAKYYLSSSLSKLGKYEEAVKMAQEALSLNQLHENYQAHANYYLGKSLTKLDRYQESIQPLQKAINSNTLKTSDQEHARYYLGCSLSQSDKHEEAVQLLESLNYSELNERDQAWASWRLGASLLLLSRRDQAANVLQKVIDSNRLNESDQTEAKFLLALTILENDAKAAKLLFEEVEESGKLKNEQYLQVCREKLIILALKEDNKAESDKYLAKILSSAKDGVQTRVLLGKGFVEYNSENFLLTGYNLLEEAAELAIDRGRTYYHEQVSPELMHALRTRVVQIKLKSEVVTVKSELVELRGDIHEMRREFSQVNGMLAVILSRLPISQASSAEDI